MPRRPSKKSKSNAKPRPVDRKNSSIKRWNTVTDIELDEEDQFHASRDKILLEGDEANDDEDGDEDEVFGLQGLSSDEEPEDEDAEYDVDMDEEPPSQKKKSKSSKSKLKSKSKQASSPSPGADSEEEEETWGRGKAAYYSSNAAQLDSDDDEANELEEQEARRLQAKARDAMLEDDFGLGEEIEGEVGAADVEELLAKPLQPSKPALPTDKASLLRHLERENPEALALARDWDDTARNLLLTQAKVAALNGMDGDTVEVGLLHLYYQALLTYATTLAFYLHLRASSKYASRPELLRTHPVLKRLLSLKQSLNTLENLGIGSTGEDEDDAEDEDDDDDDDEGTVGEEMPDLWSLISKKGLDNDELEQLLMDAATQTKPKGKTLSKPLVSQPPKKKRKTSDSDPHSKTPVFDLVEPTFPSSSSVSKKNAVHADSSNVIDAFGEATSLQHADATDKQARKKSLRFHVSRIESASARRQNARVNAAGGDDDIPYRERRKERDARLEKERLRKAGTLGMGGDDLDDVDPEDNAKVGGKKRRREMEVDADADDAEEGPDGYYQLVKQKAMEKKAKKKADYEEAQAAARPSFDSGDSSGPRSITRAILKNKGLTPHRSKSVRNPRVKKRQKFEKAKKRVSSQKAVFKGGIGDVAKYAGETSGISKVVKSVRLG